MVYKYVHGDKTIIEITARDLGECYCGTYTRAIRKVTPKNVAIFFDHKRCDGKTYKSNRSGELVCGWVFNCRPESFPKVQLL